MRPSHVATALAAFAAGLTASAALRRTAGRRLPEPAAVPATDAVAVVPPVEGPDAVVLPFPRPAALPVAVPPQPATPARCGDTGGRTKAGAACAARASAGGRCRHHPLAA